MRIEFRNSKKTERGHSCPQQSPVSQARVEPTSRFQSNTAADRNVRAPLTQNGIALVITLILLAVITFMAITFLVLSTRDRGSVTTATDQANARFANEAALERAKSDAIALMQATTNSFNYDLFVSQNYISPVGFVSGNSSITNVNYSYANGSPVLFGAPAFDGEQNLQNLFIDPRAPVYITNKAKGFQDSRYYVDLNRNGRFEPTGVFVYTNNAGLPMSNPTNSAIPLTGYFVGDPQWIGILERPGFPHSPSNRFVARIAYIALPVSKTLDVNSMHNVGRGNIGNASQYPPGFQKFDYLRDQGMGPWEENLAAFFRDLNTNSWPAGTYNYNGTNVNRVANIGNAFDDARQFLWYRNSDFNAPGKSVLGLFGVPGRDAFSFDHLDAYCDGPPMMGTTLNLSDSDVPLVNKRHWFGADNKDHFFTTQDFFDKSKTAPQPPPNTPTFTDRLLSAGTNVGSYDRGTFYRLVSQLGFDSAPEPNTKMNVSYDNLVKPNPISGATSATNFYAWTNATSFFTNAASRLFTDTFGNNKVLNLGRIPIASTNLYTASVHRLLQIAANLYDSTTNYAGANGNTTLGFPTVFRPLFRRESSGEIIIAGYREVQGTDIAFSGSAPSVAELDTGFNVNLIPALTTPLVFGPDQSEPLVSGIPLIVGAKKGWPNFNALGMQTAFNWTRKLQFLRKSANSTKLETNVMYLASITNVIGVQAWNSYTNYTTRPLELIAAVDMTAIVTNDTGMTLLSNRVRMAFTTNIAAGYWPGFNNFNNAGPSFAFAVDPATANGSFAFLTNSQYSKPKQLFISLQNPFPDDPTDFPVPHLWLKLNTRLRFIMIDTQEKRLVDYVNLDSNFSSPESRWDLTALMMNGGKCDEPRVPDGSIGSIFCTNRLGGASDVYPTYGMLNQIDVSFWGADATAGGIPGATWNSFQQTPPGHDQYGAVNFFRTNLNHTAAIPGTDASNLYLTNQFYAPYAPTRSILFYTTWLVNDPLVHYMIDDLKDFGAVTNVEFETATVSPIDDLVNRKLSKRYDPWGGHPGLTSQADAQKYDLSRKDPGMFRSDAWDFPTNRWPNIGWIGRVHRGTPWQTVYLKQPPADPGLWRIQSGNARLLVNKGQIPFSLVASNAVYEDAGLSRPTNDWRLVDLFTTAVSDNASRGQMSVNQSGLAAWSAILSGVIVLTNNATTSYLRAYGTAAGHGTPLPPPPTGSLVVDPAGAYDPYDTTVPLPPLVQLVNAINHTRGDTNLFPKQTFSHLGEILSVPELTVASPFLNRSSDFQLRYGLNDEIYERIPQQIFGLLKIDTTPRYVVYAWGQALKPADRSVIMSGPYSGLCTNYQISAEVETRTTFRIEGAPDNPRVIIENYNIVPPE